MATADIYISALQQAGKRITDQRRLICDYLAGTRSHPTPYQVYSDLARAHPEISRATVYNTLNVLQELGAIVEIGIGAGHTHYDTDTTPHINLICLRCHAVTDYDGPVTLKEVGAEIAEMDGFLPVTLRVDVFGFCEACRTRKKAEIREQWLMQRQPNQQEAAA
jgi:Fur family peroxide stress response transcriptional regulator